MTSKQVEAMRAGRERAARERRKESIERVKNYRAWLAQDAEISRRIALGETVKRKRMPAIPSDYDYQVVREDAKLPA